jgi:hypothetical protein
MTKEFKEGDKVCHIGFGHGVVDSFISKPFPIRVRFNNGVYNSFTTDGRYFTDDKFPSIYHGHGTFQFIPEPEYTWQWLYKNAEFGIYHTSRAHKSEAEFIKSRRYTPKWYQRIEESKEPA